MASFDSSMTCFSVFSVFSALSSNPGLEVLTLGTPLSDR